MGNWRSGKWLNDRGCLYNARRTDQDNKREKSDKNRAKLTDMRSLAHPNSFYNQASQSAIGLYISLGIVLRGGIKTKRGLSYIGNDKARLALGSKIQSL